MALTAPKELSIDKDRTELISLEILRFSEDIGDTSDMDVEGIKKLYNTVTEEEFIKIDDLSQPYVIRVVTSKESVLKSLEPDFLPSGDDFEMAETIQEILKGKNINVYGADFKTEDLGQASEIKKHRLSDAVKLEMVKGLKELGNITGTDKIRIASVEDICPGKGAQDIAKVIADAEIINVPIINQLGQEETTNDKKSKS